MIITDINCEDLGLSRLCLMESAGKSLSDEVAKIATFTFSKPVKIAIFAGSGGNGGDGFVAARYLLNRGYEIEIFMMRKHSDLKSHNAKLNFEILKKMEPRLSHLKIQYIEDFNILELFSKDSFSEYIIIDAILGTGINGKLKNNVRKVIEFINDSNAFTISVDVPSGMDPLTGEISDIAIKPDYTVSFHKVKTGVKKANELIGGLVTCDIGIPIEAEYFTGSGDLIKLKKRKTNSHKGNNGKLLIIGGSVEYSGAPIIASYAAISSGADLVHICSPEEASSHIKSNSPDFIVNSLDGDYLNLNHLDKILKIASYVDAVLIGPGSGLNEETAKLFNILVSKIKKPLVLDADALKLVDLSLIKNKKDLILTPHLFEFKEFFSSIINDSNIKLKLSPDDYEYNKKNISTFQSIVKSIDGTVIIKGQYDLIIQANNFKLNKTGNPGMTVGGTGDALAGLTTSLLSQGLKPFDSAVLASYLNGKAGDLAFKKYGYGFSASDMTNFIGKLMV